MATRYSYSGYLRSAAQKGRKAMAKATTKSERVVRPMKSTQGVIHRPKPSVEIFGASNRKVAPTTRLEKDGAITGTIPPRGTK